MELAFNHFERKELERFYWTQARPKPEGASRLKRARALLPDAAAGVGALGIGLLGSLGSCGLGMRVGGG
eukprot:6734876-Prymnesium_polylepis.1